MNAICLNCENEFYSKSGNAKYCSDLCRATFNQNIKNSISIKIYALKNPITDAVFYIGKTVGSLQTRLNSHIKDKEGSKEKIKIIKSILDKNEIPKIELIEEYTCENENEEINALLREKYWIDFYKKEGNICNISGYNSRFTPRILSKHQKEGSVKKTRNHSVRFDEEDFDFVSKRTGIKTGQQLVDFLLSEYCKLYKVEKPSIFFKDIPDFKKVFDAPSIATNYFKDEPKQWQEPKKILTRSAEQWHQLKRECENPEQWTELKEEILNASNLSQKQIQLIINTP